MNKRRCRPILAAPFAFLPMDTFTIHGTPLVEYDRAEQFIMASKARLFGDDLALPAILATGNSREENASTVMYATSITISGSKNANI